MQNIWLLLVLPLLGFAINGLIGKRLPKWVVGLIGCSTILFSFIVAFIAFLDLLKLDPGIRIYTYNWFTWIATSNFKVQIALQWDPLSATMVMMVTGVSFLIHVYSIGYMSHDSGFSRYFSYLNLFVFSMLTLVLANNFLMLYVGWELVGICSYLLIGFWYHKKSASDAGKKAFIVNRVGDLGFAIGILLIFITFKTLDYHEVFDVTLNGGISPIGSTIFNLICFFLFLGAMGKSAQLPLHIWLPDAMEGPTPVSALIHAATMVTAGVYMVARCHVLFLFSPAVSMLIAIIGVATALFAATIALVQTDIKRVLAYSTVSQLGYMFVAVGVAGYAAGIFHLVTHAFFKALLFMAAGSVMHAMHDELNMEKMGGLKTKLPITCITFFFGSLALSGFPLFSGFFSKDEILLYAKAGPFSNPMIYWLGIITAFLTAFYTFRLFLRIFSGKSHVSHDLMPKVHESPKVMTIPLAVLALLATFGGALSLPNIGIFKNISKKLEGFLDPVFHHGLSEIVPDMHVMHEHLHHAELGNLATSAVIGIVGIALAYFFYIKRPDIPAAMKEKFSEVYNLLWNKYYFDEVYGFIFVKGTLGIAGILYKIGDALFIEGIVNGLAILAKNLGKVLRRLQTGYVRGYAFLMLIGVVFLVSVIIWSILNLSGSL
jgi:NADH-quinone oxidoreductase subunit L